jgi:anti-sigma factor RsiW
MGILKRDHVTKSLVAYIHGELPPAERKRVAAHLEQCGACRRALAAQEQLAAHLDARLPALTSPRPEQLTRLWVGVAARIKQPPRRRSLPRPAFGVALTTSLLCIILLPLLIGGQMSADQAGVAAATQPVPALAQGSGQTAAPAGGATATAVAQASLSSTAAYATELIGPGDSTMTLAPIPTPEIGY